MTKTKEVERGEDAPSSEVPPPQGETPIMMWYLLHLSEKGNPVSKRLQPRPCYPMKKMRLAALRTSATLYNRFAKIEKYGRLKRKDWYEKYITGQLPDLFMHFLHESLAKCGIKPDEEEVRKDIEEATKKAGGIPYLFRGLKMHKEGEGGEGEGNVLETEPPL